MERGLPWIRRFRHVVGSLPRQRQEPVIAKVPLSFDGTEPAFARLWPAHIGEGNMQAITKSDLLTIIEDVGFGSAVVGGGDKDGIVIEGYLDLASLAARLEDVVVCG